MKKGYKEKAKADEETMLAGEEQEAPVPLTTHRNNILQSSFSNVEVYINNQHNYNSSGLYAHKSYISNNFKNAISEYNGAFHCQGNDYEEFPDEMMDLLLSELFFTRRMEMLCRPDGLMLYGKLGVDFCTTMELLYSSMKIRLGLIGVRPNFHMISDNPHVSLGIVIAHSKLVVLLSRIKIKRKEWTCLQIPLWSSTIWRL